VVITVPLQWVLHAFQIWQEKRNFLRFCIKISYKANYRHSSQSFYSLHQTVVSDLYTYLFLSTAFLCSYRDSPICRREHTRSSTGKCTYPHAHKPELLHSSHFIAAVVATSLAGARPSVWANCINMCRTCYNSCLSETLLSSLAQTSVWTTVTRIK